MINTVDLLNIISYGYIIKEIAKKKMFRTSHCGSAVMNPANNHEGVGWIPSWLGIQCCCEL